MVVAVAVKVGLGSVAVVFVVDVVVPKGKKQLGADVVVLNVVVVSKALVKKPSFSHTPSIKKSFHMLQNKVPKKKLCGTKFTFEASKHFESYDSVFFLRLHVPVEVSVVGASVVEFVVDVAVPKGRKQLGAAVVVLIVGFVVSGKIINT